MQLFCCQGGVQARMELFSNGAGPGGTEVMGYWAADVD